jgi:putative ABC transport system permease protein
LAQVNSGIALEFVTLSAQVEASLARERMLAALSSFFGGLALLLAAIGLYGVISYNVARRRNEIGIRVALGAEQGSIRRLVLGEVALLVCAGLAAGVAGSLAAAHLISAFLFGLTPADPATLALATALLAAVAVLAGYLPARRASRIYPMLALREE